MSDKLMNSFGEKKKLRILISNEGDGEVNFIDLAVNPKALVFKHNTEKINYLKPLDFLNPHEVKEVKNRVTAIVMDLDKEWKQYTDLFPTFFKTVGLDLCVLLETLLIGDIVLTKIWQTGNYQSINIDTIDYCENNMLEYSIAGFQYIALLNDPQWVEFRKIIVEKRKSEHSLLNYSQDVFNPPFWKIFYRRVFSIIRLSRKLNVNILSLFLAKIGLIKFSPPSLFVAPNKDITEMLKYPKSVILDDYLYVLPVKYIEVKELKEKMILTLNEYFEKQSPVLDEIKMFKNIVRDRIKGFINNRQELLATYIKMKNVSNKHLIKMVLPSSIGTSNDAWASMAVQENGGLVASGQHGGSLNSYQPYHLFSESRFSFFFTYGSESPTYSFLKKYGNADIITSGSCVLHAISKRESERPDKILKIFYIMNLCVPFYSANFPWEMILKQFETLELLNSFGKQYEIHVKEEHSKTVNRDKYPNLVFTNENPREIMNEFDLLVVESGLSTAVLEVAVTKKFIVLFTGEEWEDTSRESLDMLAKRAECFATYDEFLDGLNNILIDPEKNLDRKKLDSLDFIKVYCNPVAPESYLATIKKAMNLD